MVEMIAKKQIQIGRDRYAARGERVQVDENTAKHLADRGLADYPPAAVDLSALRSLVGYETKDVLPLPLPERRKKR